MEWRIRRDSAPFLICGHDLVTRAVSTVTIQNMMESFTDLPRESCADDGESKSPSRGGILPGALDRQPLY